MSRRVRKLVLWKMNLLWRNLLDMLQLMEEKVSIVAIVLSAARDVVASRKMKYIQQLAETDCGAACLAMVASHYKLSKSITSIREKCGTDKKGTNLAGMVQAAQKMGFSVHARKGTKEALTSELPFPFIAHFVIKHDEYALAHFVVIRK